MYRKVNALRLIDVTSFPIWDVLVNLLQDKTTEVNIIFATNNYESLSVEVQETKEITPAKVVNMNLMPRVQKEMEHQRNRTRAKAEIFTPSWICNKMNNHCDEEWFGRPELYRLELIRRCIMDCNSNCCGDYRNFDCTNKQYEQGQVYCS